MGRILSFSKTKDLEVKFGFPRLEYNLLIVCKKQTRLEFTETVKKKDNKFRTCRLRTHVLEGNPLLIYFLELIVCKERDIFVSLKARISVSFWIRPEIQGVP